MVAKRTSSRHLGVRSCAALVPLLAHLETVRPRRGPCEAHYGTPSKAPRGRYGPRYGSGRWW